MGAKVLVLGFVGAGHARDSAFVRREVSITCLQDTLRDIPVR